MRKLCYTACFGNYDHIRPPVKTKGWDYILYTDREVDGKGWEVVVMDRKEDSNTRQARSLKINLQKGYDLSIWCDASIIPICDLDAFVDDWHEKELTVMKHPGWRSLTNELQACGKLMKDDPEVMVEQVRGYFEDGYPDTIDMVATGLMIRNHTPKIRKFCRAWWREVSTKSIRDQLSFPYIAWKQKLNFGYMPWACIQGPFKQHSHR